MIVCGPLGVMEDDAPELPLVPPELVAVAVNVYDVPFVKPEITHVPARGVPDRLLIVHVAEPGAALTVSDVGRAPPASAVTVTEALVSPAIADGVCGALGAEVGEGPPAVGVTEVDAAEAPLVPPALVAVAVNV